MINRQLRPNYQSSLTSRKKPSRQVMGDALPSLLVVAFFGKVLKTCTACF